MELYGDSANFYKIRFLEIFFPTRPLAHQNRIKLWSEGIQGTTDGQWLEANRLPVIGYALGYSWSSREGNRRGCRCSTTGHPLEARGPLLWQKTIPPGSFRCSCERRRSDGLPAKRSRCGRVAPCGCPFQIRSPGRVGPFSNSPVGWGVRYQTSPRGLGGSVSNLHPWAGSCFTAVIPLTAGRVPLSAGVSGRNAGSGLGRGLLLDTGGDEPGIPVELSSGEGDRRPAGTSPPGPEGVCGWLADGYRYSQDIWGPTETCSRLRV